MGYQQKIRKGEGNNESAKFMNMVFHYILMILTHVFTFFMHTHQKMMGVRKTVTMMKEMTIVAHPHTPLKKTTQVIYLLQETEDRI